MSEGPDNVMPENLDVEKRAALWDALSIHSTDIISLVSTNGKILWTTPSGARFFDLEDANWKMKPIYDLIHDDDIKRVKREFYSMGETMGSIVGPVTFRIKTRDGSWRYMESMACNLLDSPSVEAILSISRDVTDRQVALMELEESESRYRRLVERSPESMAVYRDQHIIYANPAGLRLLGASNVEQLSRYPIVQLVHPEDRELAREAFSPVEQGQEMNSVELRLVSLDAQLIHAEIMGIPIIYDGEPSVQLLVRDVTDHKRAKAALEYQTLHDPLTGLPNRALFMDRVAQALNRTQRIGGHLIVMLADIDRFKIVNDSLSHTVGDHILVGVAQRLRACFRPSDTVARFGGDEFVVLCEDTEDLTSLGTLGERLVSSLEEPIVVNNEPFHISLSVGIAESTGGTLRADDLVRDADTAMNRAKERGRKRYEIFDEKTGTEVAGKLQLESALRHGISHGELRAYYQPVVDARTGVVTGCEALVRWQHPEQGLIPPASFIPIAEDSGLIVQLGTWMFAEACRQAKEWEELIPEGRVFKISVNLSARQFLDMGLLATVKDILSAANLDTNRMHMVFEVTESMLMADPDEAVSILNAFRNLGISIAIDDFGTGYSSFSHLKRFPVESLKIDRSFIIGIGADNDDEAIVSAVVQLAHALNLQVIAEGVETTDQLLKLRQMSCDFIQGYYFAKPAPADELYSMIERPFEVPGLGD